MAKPMATGERTTTTPAWPGQPGALQTEEVNQAFEQWYDELRVIARARLRRVGDGGPTGTDALVHECWLRLQRAQGLSFDHPGQFLALAAKVMRSTIVDAIRRAQAERRGGGAAHVTLDTGVADAVAEAPDEVLALDEALHGLGEMDKRAAQVVEMRYFAGFTDAQVAQALGISERTVRRDWDRARAFLAISLQR